VRTAGAQRGRAGRDLERQGSQLAFRGRLDRQTGLSAPSRTTVSVYSPVIGIHLAIAAADPSRNLLFPERVKLFDDDERLDLRGEIADHFFGDG